MTTTTEASTEAQVIRANTAQALKLTARATDLSLVHVNVDRHAVQLSFRTNADAAEFAQRVGAHEDATQNDHETAHGGRSRWWTTDDGWWRGERPTVVQVVGWGEDQ